MNGPILHYDRARLALEQARTLDEVKGISDRMEALRCYARQAHDPDLELSVAEIRLRAQRRLGELSRELDRVQGENPPNVPPSGHSGKRETLAAAGVSKSQAHRCEQIATVPEGAFEALLATARERKRPVTAYEVTERALRARRRDDLAARLGEPASLDAERPVPLTLADPPWRYEHVRTESRAIENQYPTLETETICELVPRELFAEHAVLYLWAPPPKNAEGLRVIDAWGFTCRTGLVWVKDRIGMGYWARQRHELLLVGTRGSPPPPAEAARPDSVIEAPRGRHSAKPESVYELLERAWPEWRGNRRELFQRAPRAGWLGWGNEASA